MSKDELSDIEWTVQAIKKIRNSVIEECARAIASYPLPLIGGKIVEMMALREALIAAIRALKS